MSPDEAFAAAVEAVRASVEQSADVTWNGGHLRGDDPVRDALEAAEDERTFLRTERWPDNRLYVDGVVLPEAVIAAYLASLRASGYVVVPVEPTKEMWAAASVEFCYDDEFPAMVSAAPAFPPEEETPA